MSSSYAALAVRDSKESFLEAILEIWGHLTPIAGPIVCTSRQELMAWTTPRCAFVRPGPAHEPNDVKIVYQPGDWAVLADFSQLMIADEESLHRLSLRFGVVLAALTQGTGTTQFDYYDGGQRFRRILSLQGGVTTEGAALPEEEGMNVAKRFSLKEMQQLWQALGLSDFALPEQGPFLAIHVIDTEAALAPRVPSAEKPWWRFW